MSQDSNPVFQYNVSKNTWTKSSGSKMPEIVFASFPTWTIQFCTGESKALKTIDLAEVRNWRAAIDCDYDSSTEPMCRSLGEDIDTSELAEGKVHVTINANTNRFLIALNGQKSCQAWFELWGMDAKGDAVYYCSFEIKALMSLDPVSGKEPEEPVSLWADRTWVESLLRAGFELQYSSDESDPSDWSAAAEDALWYRFRNREAGGQWSDPVKLPTATGSGGADSLSELSDVSDLSEATDGQALIYNAAAGKWKPGTVAGSGGGGDSYLPDPATVPAERAGHPVTYFNRDVYDDNTVLLLRGDGFADLSKSKLGVSEVGTVGIVDGPFTQALAFNGGNYLKISDAGGKLNFGTGDFTIDYRFKSDGGRYPDGASFPGVWAPAEWAEGSVQCQFKPNEVSNGMRVQWRGDDPKADAAPFDASEWCHVAIVRSGTNVYVFRNGVIVATASIGGAKTTNLAGGGYMTLGWNFDSAQCVCQVAEFRVSNVARWTANFTPPTAPYAPATSDSGYEVSASAAGGMAQFGKVTAFNPPFVTVQLYSENGTATAQAVTARVSVAASSAYAGSIAPGTFGYIIGGIFQRFEVQPSSLSDDSVRFLVSAQNGLADLVNNLPLSNFGVTVGDDGFEFDGSSYCTFDTTGRSELDFGETGDFTIDMRLTNAAQIRTYATILANGDSSDFPAGNFNFRYQSGEYGLFWQPGDPWVQTGGFSGHADDGIFHHLAITRTGGTLRMFVDGAQAISTDNAAHVLNFTAWSMIKFGKGGISDSNAENSYWTGRLKWLRISNTCRWTSNFDASQIDD